MGVFGGGATKIPPYLPLTPAIPREQEFIHVQRSKEWELKNLRV